MNLKEKRLEKDMTQAELADRLGIKRQRLSNYEVGIREPNIDTLKALAKALECTVDELIEDEDDQQGRV